MQVTHAFHSPLLEPILDEFEQCARQVKYHAPRIRLISNLTGEAARAEEIATPQYWRRHMRGTVLFHAGLQSALATGCDTFLEIGPQPHLITLSKSADNNSDLVWLPSTRKGRNAWIDILGTVQTLYQHGAEIDWRALHGKSGRPIALPTYPFERRRYWFPKKATQEPPAPDSQKNSNASESDSILQSFYEVDWATVEGDSTGHGMEGTCILFGGNGDFLASLSAALAKTGTPMAMIRRKEASAEEGQYSYETLLQAIVNQAGSPVSDVLYVAPLLLNGSSPQSCLMDFEAGMLGECLEITQALLRMDLEKTPRLWIITQGAQGSALSTIAQSTLLGFARSLAVEHPELRVARIDLDPSGDTSGEELLRSMGTANVEEELLLRGKEMVAPRIRRVPRHRAEDSAASASIRNDGAYLVTGGLSGIGLKVAAWLAERGAAQVIVMGRRSASVEAEQIFRKMRDQGVVVSVCQGDVSREADVQVAIEQAWKFALRGVFHCAGVLDDGALLQQNWDRFRRVLAPKLEGATILDRLTADLPLDHFVLFSSVASVLGSPGQTNYAAANAFLDAMAHDRRSRGLPALSINWGAWSETGFAVRNHILERGSKIGLRGISSEDGLHALELLLSGSRAQVMCALVDWNQYFAVGGADSMRPLLRDLSPGPIQQRSELRPR